MAKPNRTSAALEEERKIMSAYSDTAKTYTQLSLGALVLSVTFFEKVLGHSGRIPVDLFLLLAWLCWLVTVLAGAFYQYLAVRFVEARSEDWGLLMRGGHPQAFESLARHPWKVYTVLIIGFYLGAVFFGIVGILRLDPFT